MALTQVNTKGITDATVATADLANDAVTAAKIADNAIENNQLADGEITHNKLASNSVTSAKIVDDAVVQAAVADEAINEARLQISNAGTNGQYLQKQSGNTGGLTWADVPAGVGGATGVDFNDGVYSRWGDSTELRLHHDTNGHSYFQLESGKLFISANGGSDGVLITEKSTGDYMVWAKPAGGVNLYYDGSKKLETTSNGIELSGIAKLKAGNQLELDNGFNNKAAKIQNAEGSGTSDLRFFTGSTPAENFRITASGNAWLPNDNGKLMCGTGTDLLIYHNGTDSYVENDTGDLYLKCDGDDVIIQAADDVFIKPQAGDSGIEVLGDGGVKLFYNNSKKFETTNNGVEVTRLGIGDDAQGTHPLYVKHNQQYIAGIHNTASHATSNYPWLLHKTVDSKQAFGIHFNGLAGDKFHVDQNGAVYLGGETAAANALDDYEEGTYTPTLTAGNGSFTHNVQQAKYVKIGHIVFCTFRCSWTAHTATAQMYVSMPFTSVSGNEFGQTGAGGVSYNGSFNDAYSLTIGVLGANTIAKFYARSDDDTTYDPNPAASGRVDGWIMYYV